MGIHQGFAFDHSDKARGNAPSSGDGGPGFNAPPVPDERMDSQDALSSELSRGRGDVEAYKRDDVEAYKRAKAAASGEKSQGSEGFGLAGKGDAGFDTTGTVPSDSATTTGGDAQYTAPDYSAVPGDSNRQAGGRTI